MPYALRKQRLDRGMTLVELLVVLGLVALIGAFSMVMGVDSFKKQIFRSDRDLLISTLHRARALAISNTCFGPLCTDGLPHGVRIEADHFIIFQGNVFDPNDEYNELVERTGGSMVTGLEEVVFEPLSGRVNTVGDIVISDADAISTTTVGSEGQIFWTR